MEEEQKNGQEDVLTFKIVSFNYFPNSEDINDCNAILENGQEIRVDPFVGCAFKYENAKELLNTWFESEGHWYESDKHNCPLTFLAREGKFNLLKSFPAPHYQSKLGE